MVSLCHFRDCILKNIGERLLFYGAFNYIQFISRAQWDGFASPYEIVIGLIHCGVAKSNISSFQIVASYETQLKTSEAVVHRCSTKKKQNVLKIFAKFTGKHLCRSNFLSQLEGYSIEFY